MADGGGSNDYKWGFKTQAGYVRYLKNELEKAERAKNEAEYNLENIEAKLKAEGE